MINQIPVQEPNFASVLLSGDPLYYSFCCLWRPQLAFMCQMRGGRREGGKEEVHLFDPASKWTQKETFLSSTFKIAGIQMLLLLLPPSLPFL